MANYHYLANEPCAQWRRGVLKAQVELHKRHRVLLYEVYPLQLGMLRGLLYRKDIEFFLSEVVFAMEPLTEIERNKIQEVKYLYEDVTATLLKLTHNIGGFTALYSLINPKHEWVYKYYLKYIPALPRAEIVRRVGKAGVWTLLTVYSGAWLVPLLRTLYLSDLLANLQIGQQFELGYWSRSFVSSIMTK